MQYAGIHCIVHHGTLGMRIGAFASVLVCIGPMCVSCGGVKRKTITLSGAVGRGWVSGKCVCEGIVVGVGEA